MFKLLSCYPLLWELIEFLKALEVPLLAVRLGFESEEAEHVGKCFHCMIFLLTPGDRMKYARESGMGI